MGKLYLPSSESQFCASTSHSQAAIHQKSIHIPACLAKTRQYARSLFVQHTGQALLKKTFLSNDVALEGLLHPKYRLREDHLATFLIYL